MGEVEGVGMDLERGSEGRLFVLRHRRFDEMK